MELTGVNEKNGKVVSFLKLLSNNLCLEVSGDETSFSLDNEFAEYVKIYEGGEYRHLYSEIFPVLLEIKENNDSHSESKMLNLMANIDYIKDVLMAQMGDQVTAKGFLKFYDHVMLELRRLGAWSKYELSLRALTEDLKKIKSEVDPRVKELTETFGKIGELKRNVDEASAGVQASKDDISKLKTDFVTILGIFAAIMAALIGGIGFTNTLLSSLDKVIVYKLVAMTLICGFILFNTMIGLIHMIAKLTDRPISTTCTKNIDALKCGEPSCKPMNCSSIGKIKERLPYVFYVNKVLITLFLLDLAAWAFDLKYFIGHFQILEKNLFDKYW